MHNNKKKQNQEVRAVSRLCELYHSICLTTEEKARKNLSWGRTLVRVGIYGYNFASLDFVV
jgi:hypothetical protein